ncbi:hypothetical protein [Nocardia sp. NPDC005998]
MSRTAPGGLVPLIAPTPDAAAQRPARPNVLDQHTMWRHRAVTDLPGVAG